MISRLSLVIILVHTCNGQGEFRNYKSYRQPDLQPAYDIALDYGGRWAQGPGPENIDSGPPRYDIGYQGGGSSYDLIDPSAVTQYHDQGPVYEERRQLPAYRDVFAGRFEQFGRPTRPRSRHRSQSQRRSQRRERRRERQRLRQRQRQQPPEHIREGYIGARGGQDFFPFMGGYCAGEMCKDGGQAAGVGDGIGTGSLAEFRRRQRTGQNEDVQLYEAAFEARSPQRI